MNNQTSENNNNSLDFDFVDISICIDRSASMMKMYKETISGVNKFIEEQKNTANETNIPTNITLTVFDDISQIIPEFNNANIKLVPNVDSKYLEPQGMTLLIDTAINTLIAQNKRYIEWKNQPNNQNKSMKRIFTLLTDGDDNKSILYNINQLNDTITKFQNDGVTAIFLAANQDAISQGNLYGFQEKYSMTYNQTEECALNTFRTLSDHITSECKGQHTQGFSDLERSASCPNPTTDNNYYYHNNVSELERC